MNFSGYLLDFKGQECFAHKVKHDNKVKWNGAVWTSTVKKNILTLTSFKQHNDFERFKAQAVAEIELRTKDMRALDQKIAEIVLADVEDIDEAAEHVELLLAVKKKAQRRDHRAAAP